MSDKVRVLAVRVGQEPTIEEIESDDYKAWQKFVGGYVQAYPIGHDYHAMLNEDGMSLGLPQNGCGFLGNYFFTKFDQSDDEGDLESLTDEDIEVLRLFHKRNKDEQHSGHGLSIKSYGSVEDMINDLQAVSVAREADFAKSQRTVETGFEHQQWDEGRKEKLDQVLRECGVFLHLGDVTSAMERIELYAFERHEELKKDGR